MRNFIILTLAAVALFMSCSSTPREVVELSYHMGEDIQGLQYSYDLLISQYFDSLRTERLEYLDDEWTPRFLKYWIEDGRLVDTASGKIYWSEEEDDYVSNVGNDRTIIFESVVDWTEEVIVEIERKRHELIDPLDEAEEELKREVADAFIILMESNAAVTAHLNSLRQVQDKQEELLDAFGVKDIRNKVNSAIIEASEKASDGLEMIKQADGFVDEVGEAIGGIK